MSNEKLYENAMDAITKLFGDNSVSKSETIRNLEELIGEIKIMIDSLGE